MKEEASFLFSIPGNPHEEDPEDIRLSIGGRREGGRVLHFRRDPYEGKGGGVFSRGKKGDPSRPEGKALLLLVRKGFSEDVKGKETLTSG